MRLSIQKYKFRMLRFKEIENALFTEDLIVCGDILFPIWIRKERHILQYSDLEYAIETLDPDILIISNGNSGMVYIPIPLVTMIEENDCWIYENKTKEAVEMYNKLIQTKYKIMGAFHLSC